MGGDGVQSSDAKSGAAGSSSNSSSSSSAMAYNPIHYSSTSSGSGGSGGDNEQQHFGGQLLSAAAMMAGGAVSPVTCLVCYNAQVDVLLEPCGHQFHLHCIDRWLNKDKVCPICWNPIQSQRRLLVQAHYNSQQQQQHQQQVATPSGAQSQLPRGGYAPPPAAAPSGPAVAAPPNAANSAPLEGASAPSEPPNPAATRKGKWTTEESLYCDRLIEEFKKGNLPLAEGTTLRTFLAKLLNCDPMRISKKYTGDQCIGKIIFRRREDEVSKEDMELIRRDLAELEKTYLEREQSNQRRREKRLESELSRDKGRYVASRAALGGYTAAAPAGVARTQVPVAVAPVGQYQQPQQQANAVSAPMAAKDMHGAPQAAHHHHHAQFPPTRGPMPIQHQSNSTIHPPRYPLQAHQQQHQQQQLLQQQQQQQMQQQQMQQQQMQQQQQQPPPPMQASSNHIFNSLQNPSHHNGSNSVGPVNTPHGVSTGSGRPSGDGPYMAPTRGHSSASSSAQPDSHDQHQQQQHPHQEQQQQSNESFPRVSSIDSFSCLFPRVASIDNFQLPHQGGGTTGNVHQSNGGYSSAGGNFGESLSNSSSYDPNSGTMVKSMSIGDGLNAYFPRVQSLEQLSTLLEEHAPPSPRMKSENGGRVAKFAKDELSGVGADRRRMFDTSAVPSQPKEEQQRDADADLHRRLSPTEANKPTEHSNQIQIPKPLSKMPRSSSGIFPRIPSMDKLPRVPSLDKLPRVPSLDKLPRIPSMDKLASSSERIPRVPSIDKLAQMSRIPSHSDMLSRFGSSDHLSSFPSFSNLTSLSTCASYTNLSGLSSSGGGGFKSGFPRNSSIEDILSLVASSESNAGGMASAGSHLQLSALAAVAGEESSQMAAAADRKRRLEHAQEMESKKNKLST